MKLRLKVKIVAGSEERNVDVDVEVPQRESEPEANTHAYTYEALLARLGINPVEVIVLCNGRPVPEDEEVNGGGEIEIIRIVSGG